MRYVPPILLTVGALLIGTAQACFAQDVIELRKHDGSQYGELIKEYPDGGDIVIANYMGVGKYLIRDKDADGPSSPPTHSVGIVSVEITDSSGTVEIQFTSSFADAGV